MKLTICQIAKLFLLLTAFFFLNSHKVSSTLTTNSSDTNSSDTNSSDTNSSSGSNTNSISNNTINFSNLTEPRTLLVQQTTTQAGKVLKTTSNATATTTATFFTSTAATFISNSILSRATTATRTTKQQQQQQEPQQSRNAREFERQARQKQKPAKQQQQQQQQKPRQPRQRRQQQQRGTSSASGSAAQRVAVLIPSSLHIDMMHVQQGFQHFLEFFQVHLSNASVDFLHDVDLSGFIKLLELPKYTSVVKTLNAGINIDTDVDSNDDGKDVGDAVDPTKQPRQQQQQTQMKQLSADILSASAQQAKNLQQQQLQQQEQQLKHLKHLKQQEVTQEENTRSLGHCHQLAEQLAHDYNKSVVFWPCPHMKISSNFLPSFEAISLAVRSISSKLNWTQVDIYVGVCIKLLLLS